MLMEEEPALAPCSGWGAPAPAPPPMNRRATSDAARAFLRASSTSLAADAAEALASDAAELMSLMIAAASVREDGDPSCEEEGAAAAIMPEKSE